MTSQGRDWLPPGIWKSYWRSFCALLLLSLLAGTVFELRSQTVYRASIILDPPLRQAADCAASGCSLQSGDGRAWFLAFVSVASDRRVQKDFSIETGYEEKKDSWLSVYHHQIRQRAKVMLSGTDANVLPDQLDAFLAYVASRAGQAIVPQGIDCTTLGGACRPDGSIAAPAFYRTTRPVVERISPKPGLRLLLALISGVMAWLAWVVFRLSMTD